MDKKGKIFGVVLIIFLILVALGIGGFFGYSYLSKPKIIFEGSKSVLTCNDPDGQDIYTKGHNSYTFIDTSDNEEDVGGTSDWCEYNHPKTDRRVGLIREGICEGNTFKYIYMTCGLGYVCRNGACVKQDKSSSICQDTDSGKEPNKRGEIVGYGGSGMDDCWISFNTNPEVDGAYTPSCEGENCYVYEYYCEGDNKQYEIIKCESGCLNGACL